MLRKLRSHARQNIVGYVALFFALGGSASAAFVVSSNDQIGPDTIYGASNSAGKNDNIVAGSVGATDIAPASVGTNKVIDDSLGAIDLGPSSVGSSEIADKAIRPLDADLVNCSSVDTTQSTTSTTPVSLSGPDVYTKSGSQLWAIYVSAEMHSSDSGASARISLSVAGGTPHRILATNSTSFERRQSLPGSLDGTANLEGGFLVRPSSAETGFDLLSLRYHTDSPGATATFRNRKMCVFSVG